MRYLVLAVLVGCTSSSTGGRAGRVCTEDSDCADGLDCLEFGEFSGGTCTVVAEACSKTCTDDAGCADLGPDFKCLASCGPDKLCGLVVTGP